jgi:hypothetical protein
MDKLTTLVGDSIQKRIWLVLTLIKGRDGNTGTVRLTCPIIERPLAAAIADYLRAGQGA